MEATASCVIERTKTCVGQPSVVEGGIPRKSTTCTYRYNAVTSVQSFGHDVDVGSLLTPS